MGYESSRLSFRSGPFEFESVGPRLPFDRRTLVAAAERAYREIRGALHQPDDLESMRIVFVEGVGRATRDGVMLPTDYRTEIPLSEARYFEIYLKHEMVHFGVQVHWRWSPAPPSLLNEGLAQWLAEAPVSASTQGFSYEEFVLGLVRSGRYVPLRSFMLNHHFLGLRSDGRIVKESAAFVGFLLERWGAEKLRAAFERAAPRDERGSTTFPMPRALRDVYGEVLEGLEVTWHAYLNREILDSARAVAAIHRAYAGRTDLKPEPRCPRCGARTEAVADCPDCGASPDHELVVLD